MKRLFNPKGGLYTNQDVYIKQPSIAKLQAGEFDAATHGCSNLTYHTQHWSFKVGPAAGPAARVRHVIQPFQQKLSTHVRVYRTPTDHTAASCEYPISPHIGDGCPYAKQRTPGGIRDACSFNEQSRVMLMCLSNPGFKRASVNSCQAQVQVLTWFVCRSSQPQGDVPGVQPSLPANLPSTDPPHSWRDFIQCTICRLCPSW